MKCPKCGLINVETSERCDCGYVFKGPGESVSDTALLSSIDRSLRTIKLMMIVWFIMCLLALVGYLLNLVMK